MKNIINKIRNAVTDLDKYYGANSNNKKDFKIAYIILPILLVFFLIMTVKNRSIDRFFYGYISAMLFETFLMVISSSLYDNPKNQKNKNTKFLLLKAFVIISMSLFILTIIPVLIFFLLLNYIISFFNIEIFVRNVHIIFLDLFLYIIAYLFCIVTYAIYKLDVIVYIFMILIVCKILYWLRNFIYKKSKFISYREKYYYFYKSKNTLAYIVNTLTVLSSIAGLYFAKNTIFYILPIIIFSGIEQVNLMSIQNLSNKQKFVVELYEELVFLNDISYKQIKNFSNIKIKIKLSITPYMIANYKEYFETGELNYKYIKLKKKCNKKNRFLFDVLDNCKTMLLKEYEVYKSEEKESFENDLFNNIEKLAQYLTDKG